MLGFRMRVKQGLRVEVVGLGMYGQKFQVLGSRQKAQGTHASSFIEPPLKKR